MNNDFVLTDSQRQMHRREQLKQTAMRKSWSTDSLNSLAGGSKTCVCAPTSHPGSFKCRYHRHPSNMNLAAQANQPTSSTIFEEKSEDDASELSSKEKTEPHQVSENTTTDNKVTFEV